MLPELGKLTTVCEQCVSKCCANTFTVRRSDFLSPSCDIRPSWTQVARYYYLLIARHTRSEKKCLFSGQGKYVMGSSYSLSSLLEGGVSVVS